MFLFLEMFTIVRVLLCAPEFALITIQTHVLGFTPHPHILGYPLAIEAFKMWYYSLIASIILGLYDLYSPPEAQPNSNSHVASEVIDEKTTLADSNINAEVTISKQASDATIHSTVPPTPSDSPSSPSTPPSLRSTTITNLLIDILDILIPAYVIQWPHWATPLSYVSPSFKVDGGVVGIVMAVGSALSLGMLWNDIS